MAKLHERPVALFTKPGQVRHLILPDGFRFIAFVRGEQPFVLPIDEQGSYEIDIPEMLAAGKYPVAVISVDASIAPAFAAMSAAKVEEMLNASAAFMEAQP